MIRIGLIGAGAIAHEHAKALRATSGAAVTHVADLSEARSRYLIDKHQLKAVPGRLEDVLGADRPDWVHVTTPPHSHHDVTRQCLEAGVNVLCEKPLALSLDSYRELADLAASKGLWLLENQNLRFHSSVVRLRNLIQQGKFGKLVDFQVMLGLNIYSAGSPYNDPNVPHFTTRMRGGPISDFLPHFGYLLEHFIGAPLVQSKLWTKQNAAPPHRYDEFRAQLSGDAALGSVSFSGSSQPDGFWIKVCGTEMYAEANLFEPPRVQMRRNISAPAPVPAIRNGLGESWSLLTGTCRSTLRKLSGASPYDGMAEFFGELYARYAKGLEPPVSDAQRDTCVRLVLQLEPDAGES